MYQHRNRFAYRYRMEFDPRSISPTLDRIGWVSGRSFAPRDELRHVADAKRGVLAVGKSRHGMSFLSEICVRDWNHEYMLETRTPGRS